jgi:hypothetical protein
MQSRSLIVFFALICASCSQVTGHVKGTDIVDLAARSNAPSTCSTKITRTQSSTIDRGEEVGVILVEGAIWVSPAEMDRLLRAAGCDAGASELVVLDEAYGQLGVGSWARAAVFTKAAASGA